MRIKRQERITVRSIHLRVSSLGNAQLATGFQRFFKTGPGEYGEGDRFLGIRVPVIRNLSREYQSLPLRDVARLLKSKWHEERLLALFILVRKYAASGHSHREEIFRLYLASTSHINNWDLVDCSAAQIVGVHLLDGGRAHLIQLARSDLLWERRIAIIATFPYVKRGELDDTLRIAQLLLVDPHDLIHKAVGWLLREVGKQDRTVLEGFLSEYAKRMPRTMLRYAIEHFPEKLRRQYLTRV